MNRPTPARHSVGRRRAARVVPEAVPMDRATLLWWIGAVLLLVAIAALLFYFDQRIPRAAPFGSAPAVM